MKKTTKETPVYKNILDGVTIVEVFITEDGAEFSTEEAALKHESEIKYKKIKKMFSLRISSSLFDDWYNPKNEEELDSLKRHFGFYDQGNIVEVCGELKAGAWISTIFKYGGDYDRDRVIFVTLEFLEQDFLELIKEIKG